MNRAPGALPKGSEHHPVARAWRGLAGFGACLAVVVGAVAYWEAQPHLSAEEAAVAGLWYGYRRDERANYAWLSDYRSDHTCSIQFRNFYDDGASELAEESGRWRCQGGRRICETWTRDSEITVWQKLATLVTEFRWPEQMVYHEEYELERVQSDEYLYTQVGAGVTYRAVRVPGNFVLPNEPMTPEQALAWWAERTDETK